MRAPLLFGIFLIGCAHGQVANRPGKLAPFHSPDGKFTVLLPRPPQEQKVTSSTSEGPVEGHVYTASNDDESGGYFVGYADYPESSKRPIEILDGARDGALANAGGELLEDHEVQLAETPGREFRFRTKSADAVSRVYLAGHRLYTLTAVAPPGKLPAEELKKIFDSFTIEK